MLPGHRWDLLEDTTIDHPLAPLARVPLTGRLSLTAVASTFLLEGINLLHKMTTSSSLWRGLPRWKQMQYDRAKTPAKTDQL